MLFFVPNATSKCQNKSHTPLKRITRVKHIPMNIHLMVDIVANFI